MRDGKWTLNSEGGWNGDGDGDGGSLSNKDV